MATNGLCISVTAKRQTKPGETVEIYDGYSSNCLVFQGESLQGVNIVSEGPVLTVSNLLFLISDFVVKEQSYCRLFSKVQTFLNQMDWTFTTNCNVPCQVYFNLFSLHI